MKRQRGEITKSLVLALVFAVSLTISAPVVRADSQTQTFKKDLDFSVWTKTRTELVGNDAGVRLSTNPTTSGYYTSGTLTYKFTPGGVNRWTSATTDIASVDTSDAWYSWGGEHKSNSVKQIDPETGTFLNSWPTNTSALAGTAGISADYWVSNLSPFDNNSQTYGCSSANDSSNLCYSISHILPSQNKIVTRKIPTTTNRNLVTLSFDTTNHNLWIGDSVNNEVIILNTDNFDNTSSALSYETVATTYSPYRSAFSQAANALCFTSYQVGVECISNEAAHTGITLSESRANDIYLDSNGDFWYSGETIYKIRPEFSGESASMLSQTFASPLSSLYDLDSAGDYKGIDQIVIVPDYEASPPNTYTSKIELSYSRMQTIYYYNITNKPLPQLSSIDGSGRVLNTPTTINSNYRHSLNVSPAGDTVFSSVGLCSGSSSPCARVYSVMPKGDSPTGSYPTYIYNRGTFAPTDSRSQHKFYPFENFIASSFGLSDKGVKLEYSTDNVTWTEGGADGSISISDSPDLYIKVSLTGTQSSSPILRSLALNYQSSLADNAKTIVTRSMYKSAADRDSGTASPISTFESGQKVYVRTKIFEPSSRRNNVKLEETVTGISNFSATTFVYKIGSDKCTSVLQASERGITVNATDPTYTFSIPYITSGLTCIDYEYVQTSS